MARTAANRITQLRKILREIKLIYLCLEIKRMSMNESDRGNRLGVVAQARRWGAVLGKWLDQGGFGLDAANQAVGARNMAAKRPQRAHLPLVCGDHQGSCDHVPLLRPGCPDTAPHPPRQADPRGQQDQPPT